MLDLDEAQRRLLALAPKMPCEEVATADAAGRVLAGDLASLRAQPASDVSAMDGYAVAAEEPWALVGESRAGKRFEGSLEGGQCVRIFTGAPVPPGAAAVLMQESAQVAGDRVTAREVPSEGAFIRRRGFDFGAGNPLLPRGSRMGAAQIGLALAGGHGRVLVAARPRVAVLDCGDELVRDPAEADRDQIPASNGAMIAAMLHGLAEPGTLPPPVPDSMQALERALDRTRDADILITSGGASVGDHDLVRGALIESGAKLVFWKVAMKPGKPLMVATRPGGRGTQVVLGLPGNPVSSFVTAFLFALPLVRAAMGMSEPLPTPIALPCSEPLPETGGRHEFLRGVVEDSHVQRAPSQHSSALRSLALADCLVHRPPHAPATRPGDMAETFLLHNG